MYTSKNLISLGNHDEYTIYLDVNEGELKKQAIDPNTNNSKVYIAVVLTLALGRMNLFADLLSDTLFKIVFYFFAIFVSIVGTILVANHIFSKEYSNIVLEKVMYSPEEYREFKARLKKYNRMISALIIIFLLSLVMLSAVYFLSSRFIFLIIISVNFGVIYFICKYGELRKRKYFEDYLTVDYMDES